MSHIEFVDDILVYNSVSAVSGLFADTVEVRSGISSPDLNQVKAASANWDSVYLTVSANSAAWDIDYDGADIKALTANWENTYIINSGLSADWTTAFNTVCAWGSSSVPDIALRFSADVLGNGIDNTYTYFHGLGTKDLVVSVIEIATGNIALAAVYVTDTQITVEFASPVTGTLYRLVAIGATNLADYRTLSANWQNTFTTVSSNSSNWETTYTTFRDQSGNFLTSESQSLSFDDSTKELGLVGGNSVSLSAFSNELSQLSGNWESTYTTFRDQSGTFLTTESDSQTLSFNDATKELSITSGNSVSLSSLDVTGLSSNWESTFTTVKTNSATWDYQGTDIKSLTGNWENTYATVSSSSANWQSAYNTIKDVSGSYLPLSGGTLTGKLIASASDIEAKLNIGTRLTGGSPNTVSAGDLWISNQGVLTYRDTTVARAIASTSLSNTFNQPQTIGSTATGPILNVTNSGTGQAAVFVANSLSAAVRITQTGGGNSILVEDDTNPDATPFIVDNLGNVGIGLSSMAGVPVKLAVVGSLSATSVVYASGGNSDIWNSTYTSVSSNSASWSAIPQVVEATVFNADTVTLTRGNVVYSFGATGDTMSVKLASNSGESTSSKTLGFVNGTIAPGSTGTVTIVGRMENLNFGTPYVDGDALWLGTVPGTYTRTKPIAPNHGVYLGVVERANSGNGIAYVKVQNGYELNEIHDVAITTPLSGQMLRRNSANTLWINTDDGTKWDSTYTTVNANSANWDAAASRTFGSEYSFNEQFLNNASLGGNLVVGTTTGGLLTVATSGVFGQAQLTTGTNATAGSNVRIQSGANQFNVIGNGTLDYAIRFNQSSSVWFDGTLTGAFRAGLMTSFNTDSTGIYFRLVNGSALQFVSRSGGSESVLTLDPNITQGPFHLCQFSINSAGTSITVKYNGAVVGTVTTNIPTAGLFHNICLIRDSATGTAVTANLDFVAMRFVPNTAFFTF